MILILQDHSCGDKSREAIMALIFGISGWSPRGNNGALDALSMCWAALVTTMSLDRLIEIANKCEQYPFEQNHQERVEDRDPFTLLEFLTSEGGILLEIPRSGNEPIRVYTIGDASYNCCVNLAIELGYHIVDKCRENRCH